MQISQIKKRDGRLVFFRKEKIIDAIRKAFLETGEGDSYSPETVANKVVEYISQENTSVEEIQDIIEKVLIETGYRKTAKTYILYRRGREYIRNIKKEIGIIDDLKLKISAVYLLKQRYISKKQDGNFENTSEMFQRVASSVSRADEYYNSDSSKVEKEFFEIMTNLEFLPSSPTIMNAGKGNLISAYAIPIEDSIKSIYKAIMSAAIVQQNCGGTGFSFSNIRPKDDEVYSSYSKAPGPLLFMKSFDSSLDSILQGGKRKGANIATLRVNHPDIADFVSLKNKENSMKNFNLSVAVDQKFMDAVENDNYIDLINPRTKKTLQRVMAKDIWKLIISTAWRCGDPGMIFVNNDNDETSSPCGEMRLLPYEGCALGSINLSKFVKDGKIDWDRLKYVVHKSVHFLDNVIDVNIYPIKESEEITKNNRKIGLGVMGFADMLIDMGIPYDSQKALNIADDLIRFIKEESVKASVLLAEKRKPFPNFKKSELSKKYGMIRNANILAISPTGSISIIADCSPGIEPIFSITYSKKIVGKEFLEVNRYFEKIAKQRGFYSQELMTKIMKHGSLKDVVEIPYDVKRLFFTTFDIDPEWHIKMQEVFQKHVDGSVSKTVNLKENANPEDVEKVFTLAYKLGCKGVTVYRYNSRHDQVQNVGV